MSTQPVSIPVTGPTAAAPATEARAANKAAGTAMLLLFRLALTLHVVLLWLQPILIGLFLSGHYGMLAAHSLVGGLVMPSGMLVFVSSILLWKPGGRGAWPIAIAASLMVGEVVQISSGWLRSLGLHVPLGVALAGSALAFLVWGWWPARNPNRIPNERLNRSRNTSGKTR